LGALGDADAALYLAEAFKDDALQVRTGVLAAMGRMKTDVIIRPLLEALANPSDPLRMEVLPILVRTGDPAVIGDISNLLKDPTEDVRLAAVNALGTLKHAQCVPALEAVLAKEGEAWNVKHWALHSLMAIGGKECTPAALGALDDKDEQVRVSACEAVGRLRISEASARLMAMLDGEKTDMARAAACRALGRLGDAGAKERMAALASSSPGLLMTCGIEALCRLGDTSRVAELGGILKENRFRSWEWRAARRIAAHAIGEFGKKEDILLLAPGMDDDDPELVRQTLFALDRLDGKSVEMPWVVLHSTRDASDPMAVGMMMEPPPQVQERRAAWAARLKEMRREQEKQGE
jgi:HEAT repeat protein